MRTLTIITSIALLFAVTSCAKRTNIDKQLRHAEETMFLYPDSSLATLNSISVTDIKKDKQKALYALLLTQARDRNYLDSMQSDSLIALAVEYYERSNDKRLLGISYFYSAKLLSYNGKDTEALQMLLKSQKALESVSEYNMLSLVHHAIAAINYNQNLFDWAIKNYEEATRYEKIAKDSSRIIYTYRDLAWIYELKNNADSMALYANKARALLNGDSLSYIYSSIMQLLGRCDENRGDYNSAITKYQSAIRNEKFTEFLATYYLPLGRSYKQTGDFDLAKVYLDMAASTGSDYIKAGAFDLLSEMEYLSQNSQTAYRYKVLSDSLYHKFYNDKLKEELSGIQIKTDIERIEMEKTIIEQRKTIQFYIWFTITSGLLIIALLSYRYIKRHYLQASRRWMKKRIEKEIEFNRINTERTQSLLDEIKRQTTNAENTKHELGKLKQNFILLKNENHDIKNNNDMFAIYLIKELKQGKLIVEKLSQKEMDSIMTYMDSFYDNFITKLKDRYSLNEKNILFIVLLKLEFDNNTLEIVYDCELNSIYKKKQRIKDRLNLQKNDDLDAFIRAI